MKVAIYVRCSTAEQTVENQLRELRTYATARGWTATEFADEGISGVRDSRPALDAMMREVRKRRFDVVLCWSLDRVGRSLRNLVLLLDELQALNVPLVSLKEGLDLSSPAGRLQWQIIAAISEFERSRLVDRVKAGLSRAKAQGKRLGRPVGRVPVDRLATVRGLSDREAAKRLGVARSTLQRWRQAARENPPQSA